MTVDFTKSVLSHLVFDGTTGYMVTLENGWPYDVIQNDPPCQWSNLWPDVQAWLAAGNTATPYVPPAPVPPDPVMVANATLQDLMFKYVNSVMVGPSAPLTFAAQWLAAWKAAGN